MMHLIEFSGPDDYIVIFEGEEGHSFEIGHIFRSVYGPEDRPWLWCIQFRHRASRSPNQRDDLNGTRSADFIRASGLCAAQTGRTHDRTRPTRQNITKALANRRPSTHALLNCPRFWVESPKICKIWG
jgi:hypothetical protein